MTVVAPKGGVPAMVKITEKVAAPAVESVKSTPEVKKAPEPQPAYESVKEAPSLTKTAPAAEPAKPQEAPKAET